MSKELELDQDGNVKIRAVTGWTTHSVAGIAALLAIEYIESPQEFDGTHKSLQLALTAPQCIELAGVLTRAGKALLQDTTATRPM